MAGPGLRRPSSSSDEESNHRQPTDLRPNRPNPSRVKRALFGPTDHEENLRFVRQELKKHKNEANSRWNFDFDTGRPMKGRLDWEQVPREQLHPVYNLSRMQYLSSHEDNRENRLGAPEPSSGSQGPSTGGLGQEPQGSSSDLRTPDPRTPGAPPTRPGGEDRLGGAPAPSSSSTSTLKVISTAAVSSTRVSSTSTTASLSSRLQPSSVSQSTQQTQSIMTRLTGRPPASVSGGPAASSTLSGGHASSSTSLLDIGAIPKTKETKINEVFRSRKATRSKSSSRLGNLKRLGALGGGSRSPSVKARGGPAPRPAAASRPPQSEEAATASD